MTILMIKRWETEAIIQKKKTIEDNNQATRDRLRDLPEWMGEFRVSLEDTDALAPTHISSLLRFGRSYE